MKSCYYWSLGKKTLIQPDVVRSASFAHSRANNHGLTPRVDPSIAPSNITSLDHLCPHPSHHSPPSTYCSITMSLRPGPPDPVPSSRKRRRTSPREFDDSRPAAQSILFPVSFPVPDRTDTMTESHPDWILTGVLWFPASGHPCSSRFHCSWTERSIGL
jgi:hypothetical protein